jgi:PEGA domain
MLSIRTCVVACAFLCIVTAASQTNPLNREFQDGVDAYRLGDYAQARVHLEKARALDAKLPGPHRFLAAVAFAENQFKDCVTHAEIALRLAPQSREIQDTRKLHEACRLADGRPAFTGRFGEGGAITVNAVAAGVSVVAAVSINGKSSGVTPTAARAIPAGLHQIRVIRSGLPEATATVTVLPGVVIDVELVLSPPGPTAAPTPARGWIELSPAGLQAATITIDGVAIDLAARIALIPGRHTIVIVKPGKLPWSQSFEVAVDQVKKLTPVFRDARNKQGSRPAPRPV